MRWDVVWLHAIVRSACKEKRGRSVGRAICSECRPHRHVRARAHRTEIRIINMAERWNHPPRVSTTDLTVGRFHIAKKLKKKRKRKADERRHLLDSSHRGTLAARFTTQPTFYLLVFRRESRQVSVFPCYR